MLNLHGTPTKTVYVSGYFDQNAILITGACSKCFLEDTDVKITGANQQFLDYVQTAGNKHNSPDIKNQSSTGIKTQIDASENTRSIVEENPDQNERRDSNMKEKREVKCFNLEALEENTVSSSIIENEDFQRKFSLVEKIPKSLLSKVQPGIRFNTTKTIIPLLNETNIKETTNKDTETPNNITNQNGFVGGNDHISEDTICNQKEFDNPKQKLRHMGLMNKLPRNVSRPNIQNNEETTSTKKLSKTVSDNQTFFKSTYAGETSEKRSEKFTYNFRSKTNKRDKCIYFSPTSVFKNRPKYKQNKTISKGKRNTSNKSKMLTESKYFAANLHIRSSDSRRNDESFTSNNGLKVNETSFQHHSFSNLKTIDGSPSANINNEEILQPQFTGNIQREAALEEGPDFEVEEQNDQVKMKEKNDCNSCCDSVAVSGKTCSRLKDEGLNKEKLVYMDDTVDKMEYFWKNNIHTMKESSSSEIHTPKHDLEKEINVENMEYQPNNISLHEMYFCETSKIISGKINTAKSYEQKLDYLAHLKERPNCIKLKKDEPHLLIEVEKIGIQNYNLTKKDLSEEKTLEKNEELQNEIVILDKKRATSIEESSIVGNMKSFESITSKEIPIKEESLENMELLDDIHSPNCIIEDNYMSLNGDNEQTSIEDTVFSIENIAIIGDECYKTSQNNDFMNAKSEVKRRKTQDNWHEDHFNCNSDKYKQMEEEVNGEPIIENKIASVYFTTPLQISKRSSVKLSKNFAKSNTSEHIRSLIVKQETFNGNINSETMSNFEENSTNISVEQTNKPVESNLKNFELRSNVNGNDTKSEPPKKIEDIEAPNTENVCATSEENSKYFKEKCKVSGFVKSIDFDVGKHRIQRLDLDENNFKEKFEDPIFDLVENKFRETFEDAIFPKCSEQCSVSQISSFVKINSRDQKVDTTFADTPKILEEKCEETTFSTHSASNMINKQRHISIENHSESMDESCEEETVEIDEEEIVENYEEDIKEYCFENLDTSTHLNMSLNDILCIYPKTERTLKVEDVNSPENMWRPHIGNTIDGVATCTSLPKKEENYFEAKTDPCKLDLVNENKCGHLSESNCKTDTVVLYKKNQIAKEESCDRNNYADTDIKDVNNVEYKIGDKIELKKDSTEASKLYAQPLFDPFSSPEYYWKPIWNPPKSPHNLIEENLYNDPWGLLVATIFLNKTSCYQARPYVEEFLKDNPTPGHVLTKNPYEFEKYFINIGLKKRSIQIWRMTHDFVYKQWKTVRDLYGIGKYGEDAFRMFCLGDLNIEPTDRFLKIYQAWAKMVEQDEGCSQIERLSQQCSQFDEF